MGLQPSPGRRTSLMPARIVLKPRSSFAGAAPARTICMLRAARRLMHEDRCGAATRVKVGASSIVEAIVTESKCNKLEAR